MPQLVVDQTKEIGTQIALEASVSPDMQNKYEYKLTELKKKINSARIQTWVTHMIPLSQLSYSLNTGQELYLLNNDELMEIRTIISRLFLFFCFSVDSNLEN